MSKKDSWGRMDGWELDDEDDTYLVFVARIEAVQRKWRGGLVGYLEKYRGEHNDGIVSNYAVGLAFELQLIDLIENGLEMYRDFVFFDTRDDGANLNGAPYPMPVSWLGGLFRNGSVIVFLKQ